MSLEVLYKSDSVIAAVKPPMTLSEDAPTGGMPALVEAEYGIRPLTVHRLDREVGGAMVYAASPASAAELTRQISGGALYKGYLAVVCGVPENERGEMRDLLYHDRVKNKTYVVTRERRGVRSAALEYRLLGTRETEAGKLSLVAVHLLTGRTHQIRAQFSGRHMPIAGDTRYGGRKSHGISLWSTVLRFRDPGDGSPVEVYSLPAKHQGEFDLFTDEINSFMEERFDI